MIFKNFFMSLALLTLFALFPREVSAIGYPALDTTSHWTIGSVTYNSGGGLQFRNVTKKIWTSPGVSEEKTVFYEYSAIGVRRGTSEYYLPNPFVINPVGSPGMYIADFKNIIPNVHAYMVFDFTPNGKFHHSAFFYGSGYNVADQWSIITKIDYDIGGSGNNIAEFLWNRNSEGGTISPPQYPNNDALDGKLTYNLPGSGNNDYWSTTNHEITISYPKMKRTTGPGVENLGFARIINTNYPEFGLVMWTDSVTDIQATFKSYTSGNNLNPSANVTIPLQNTTEYGSYPRTAYLGRDQMMYLKTSTTTPNPNGVINIGMKLFQRPSVPSVSRPLLVRVHQHPAADLAGMRFDPDEKYITPSNGIRSFRIALQELVGVENLVIQRSGENGMPYLPYNGYPGPGQSVTEAQLHNLMVNVRNYSAANLENVREWQMDIFIVNWTLSGDPTVQSEMFDYGNINSNRIAREGAVVFWKSMANRSSDYRKYQTILGSLQGVGSMLNMSPSWSTCPFAGYCWNDASSCGGRKCGASCPSGVSNCYYTAYTCQKECINGSIMTFTEYYRNSFKFNFSPAQGSPYSEVDWFRLAPEAWVKPGRCGMPSVSGPMPPF